MMTKKCSRCGLNKHTDEFYERSNVCKTCKKEISKESVNRRKDYVKQYQKRYHAEHKEEAKAKNLLYAAKIESLKTPCVKCGEDRLYVIDFHHVDPAKKEFNIHRKKAAKNFSSIEEEAKKCICLCRNCHMEFHYFYGLKPKNPEAALADYLGEYYGI